MFLKEQDTINHDHHLSINPVHRKTFSNCAIQKLRPLISLVENFIMETNDSSVRNKHGFIRLTND